MGCEICWVCQDYPIKLSAFFQCNLLRGNTGPVDVQARVFRGQGSVKERGQVVGHPNDITSIHDSLPYQNKVDATIIPFLNKLKTPTEHTATKREPFYCCLFLFCIR